jgi:hypothetical protein
MNLLYTSAQVRQKIRDLFYSSKGRRIAITAFVGDGAESYLPKPEGIELICWPKAGGTNPNAIRKMLDRKVKVFFADSLHMKVYWTEDKGAVITSANLSTYALGSGGLKEIGIFLPPGKLDIDKIVKSIKRRPFSEAELLKLDNTHKEYRKRNPGSTVKRPDAISFREWYGLKGPPWKISGYIYDDVPLSSKARAVLRDEFGVSECEEVMTAERGRFKKNDWILGFNMEDDRVSGIGWMFAHHVVKVSQSDRAYDRYTPYQILQAYPLKTYDLPPFGLDKSFRTAFKQATHEYGGISKLLNLKSANPSPKFIDLIYASYEQAIK